MKTEKILSPRIKKLLFLATHVLAGSLSYIILDETFNWEEGLDEIFHDAKGFYITLIVSLIIGPALALRGIVERDRICRN